MAQGGVGLFLGLFELVVARLDLLHTFEVGGQLVRRLDQGTNLGIGDGEGLVIGCTESRASWSNPIAE